MKLLTISEKGLNLIKEFEGCKLKAYKCPAGVWTIAYGHVRGVTEGMTISQSIADKLLKEDVAPLEKALNALKINFRQGQFDALVSFMFNRGEGAFGRSTLKKKIFAGARDEEIAAEFGKWNKAGGKVLAGLTKRREAEAKLWME